MKTPAEFERLFVVLVSARNPLNIGAAARAMSNFGFLRLRVVNSYDVPFLEARSAVGASSVLAEAEQFASVAESVADCTLVIGTTATGHRELQHQLRTLREGAPLLRERMRSSRVALLFGSEKTGLTANDLSHCHWLLHIPTRDEHLSMNLGQAVAVCLYELAQDAPNMQLDDEAEESRATLRMLERLNSVLADVLVKSEYVNDPAPADMDERVRRLVRRLELDARDAELLLGMLRQILWKLRTGPR